MKLKSLKNVEVLNTEQLDYVAGGSAAADSNKNDSKEKDCKKNDEFGKG